MTFFISFSRLLRIRCSRRIMVRRVGGCGERRGGVAFRSVFYRSFVFSFVLVVVARFGSIG